MHAYEIRILKNDRDMSLVFSSSQPSDDAAIRVAKKLAADRPLEVWRDMDCICREGVSPAFHAA
jgi:hypothetical protein